MFVRAALAAAVLAAPALAHADDGAPAPIEWSNHEPLHGPSAQRRAGAVALAIVPGVVVRGLGSYTVGAPRTGRRVLQLAGLGLAAATVGGVPVGLTYGNDKTIVPGVHLLVGGFGLVLASWWSDVYAAAGGARAGGAPRSLPGLAVGVAARWQHDGFQGERVFALPHVDARRGRLAARAEAFVAHDGSAWGGRGELGVRLRGRVRGHRADRANHDGSFVEARAALQVRAERDDGYRLVTGELELRGRLELGVVDRNLAGSFFELSEGLGVEASTYAAGGTDLTALLLSRFSYGVYLPRGAGSLAVFYDHRRDHLAGGLAAGRAAGFFGSVGAQGALVLGGGRALVGEVEVGSAWVTTIGLEQELP